MSDYAVMSALGLFVVGLALFVWWAGHVGLERQIKDAKKARADGAFARMLKPWGTKGKDSTGAGDGT